LDEILIDQKNEKEYLSIPNDLQKCINETLLDCDLIKMKLKSNHLNFLSEYPPNKHDRKPTLNRKINPKFNYFH